MFLLLLNYLLEICLCKPIEGVPVPMEILSLDSYYERREKIDSDGIFIVYQTNTTGASKNDITDIFQSGAEIAAAFVRNGLLFGIVYDQKVKYNRVVCYYPGIPEGYFRVHKYMIPAQVATKILHLASRTLKQIRRNRKEEKNPGIARIKNELRNVRKLLKTTADEEKRNNLLQTKEDLINEFLESIPDEKREARLLKLKNKDIIDKNDRKKANEAVHELKKKYQKNDASKNDELKKFIDKLRASWKSSRIDESEHNVEEELTKLRFERKQRQEEMEDDSEEVEQLYRLFNGLKTVAGPDEDLGEIDQRLEMMKKVRQRRHERQKKEGTYRPRNARGEYLYDDPGIRTSVDDATNVGLEDIDLTPIKNKREEDERKKKEISKDKRPPEINDEMIEGQYEGL